MDESKPLLNNRCSLKTLPFTSPLSTYKNAPSQFLHYPLQNKAHYQNFRHRNTVKSSNRPSTALPIEEMSLEKAKNLPETEYSGGLKTELTLGLPGGGQTQAPKSGDKRGFPDTVDLNMGSNYEYDRSVSSKLPPAKSQVVGWPPIRCHRKNATTYCKYVKVAVDGAPYLRKVDLEIYGGYQELLDALEDMFTCLNISNALNDRKNMDCENGVQYVPTYEDRDGDWMLVGDVPWTMFVESCKRLRLMKSTEAIGLAPKTPSKGSSTS